LILERQLNVHIVNTMKTCSNMWTIVGMIVAALCARANDTFCNCNERTPSRVGGEFPHYIATLSAAIGTNPRGASFGCIRPTHSGG
jgi:hypothetical protein